MSIPTMPSAATEREHEQARRHPERETLELATAGAAQVLGPDPQKHMPRGPRPQHNRRSRRAQPPEAGRSTPFIWVICT